MTDSSRLLAEPARECLLSAEADCDRPWEAMEERRGSVAKTMGELRVDVRPRSYDGAETGDVRWLFMFWLAKGLEPRRIMELGRE